MPTWLVIGASRGIGLELVRQLLSQGHQVIAAVRDPTTANQLWQTTANQSRPASCLIEQCDVTSQPSIDVSYPPRRIAAPRIPPASCGQKTDTFPGIRWKDANRSAERAEDRECRAERWYTQIPKRGCPATKCWLSKLIMLIESHRNVSRQDERSKSCQKLATAPPGLRCCV